MNPLMVSERVRQSAALLLTKNKGRDTIIKKERKTGRERAAMENQRDFCTECRRETNYTLKKIKINWTIREKEYTFEITAAFCNECGGEMGILGLMDYNMKEIDEQYRKASDNIGG